ncbi:MAG: hypothetical protein ACRD4U_10440 [Candidatus Acidiferrales bacterium]
MLEVPRQLQFGPGPPLEILWRRSLPPPGPVYQRGNNYPFTVHRPRRNSVFVRWPGLGDFLIEGRGRRILARPEPGAPAGELRDLVVTTIASFALVERGVETLHASAVEVAGQAIAFAGTGASGKSSLAAFFAQRGHRLLTDDVLPVASRAGRVFAYSGLPEVKLDPAAVRALGLDSKRLRGYSGYPKRYWRVPLDRGPRRLAALYFPRLVRSSGAKVRLVRLSPAVTFRTLLGHTFTASLRPRTRLRRQFALFTRMARTVPARRLIIPRGWKNLEEVARRIEADLKQLQS